MCYVGLFFRGWMGCGLCSAQTRTALRFGGVMPRVPLFLSVNSMMIRRSANVWRGYEGNCRNVQGDSATHARSG